VPSLNPSSAGSSPARPASTSCTIKPTRRFPPASAVAARARTVGVTDKLLPYLPSPRVLREADGTSGWRREGERSTSIAGCGRYTASTGVLVRAFTYISATVGSGLKRQDDAVLAATTSSEARGHVRPAIPAPLQARIRGPRPDRSARHRGTHPGHAKRLIDFGFHPPTISNSRSSSTRACSSSQPKTEPVETLDAFATRSSQSPGRRTKRRRVVHDARHRARRRLDEATAARTTQPALAAGSASCRRGALTGRAALKPTFGFLAYRVLAKTDPEAAKTKPRGPARAPCLDPLHADCESVSSSPHRRQEFSIDEVAAGRSRRASWFVSRPPVRLRQYTIRKEPDIGFQRCAAGSGARGDTTGSGRQRSWVGAAAVASSRRRTGAVKRGVVWTTAGVGSLLAMRITRRRSIERLDRLPSRLAR